MNSGNGERVKITSASAGDTTQHATLQGYATTGVWLSESVALTGTTPALSVGTFLHLCSVILDGTAAGIVTVAGNTTSNAIHAIPIGELGAQRMFIKATANASGGADKTLYEKVFIGNGHASSAVISALIWQAAQVNSGSEISTIALECAGGTGSAYQVTGGTESAASRVTAPTGGGTYTFAAAGSAGAGLTAGTAASGNLVAGEYQGVWVKLVLPNGTAPNQVTAWTPELDATAT